MNIKFIILSVHDGKESKCAQLFRKKCVSVIKNVYKYKYIYMFIFKHNEHAFCSMERSSKDL